MWLLENMENLYKFGVRLTFSGNSCILFLMKNGKIRQKVKEKEQIA
jgi:hypothetical protein